MDRITKSYPVTFRQQQSFEALADSELFVYFVDFCVLSVARDEEFDTGVSMSVAPTTPMSDIRRLS